MKRGALIVIIIVIILIIAGLTIFLLLKSNTSNVKVSNDKLNDIKNTLTNITEHLYECYNNCSVDNSNDWGIMDYSCSIDCHNYNNRLEVELRKYSMKELIGFREKNFDFYAQYDFIQECAVSSCTDDNYRQFKEGTLDCFSEKNNINDCYNKIHLPNNRLLCVNYIALKTKDYSVCDEYPEYSYGAYGGIVGNPNRKDGINSCYMEVAISKGDLSKCEEILKGKWSSPDDCYAGVAAVKGDLNICEKIKEKSTKDDCISKVILNTALIKKDWKICKKIDDESKKDNCIANVAIFNENITICEKIGNKLRVDEYSGTYKENCYIYLIMYGDESICNKIRDEKMKKYCYESFSN